MDELITVGTYTVVLAHHVVCRIVVVVVVDALAPVLHVVAVVEYRHERTSRHVLRLRNAGESEERRSIVDVLHKAVAYRAGLGVTRIAHDERCAQRLLVHEALVEPAVLAHVEALVGGVYNHCVVGESVLVEIVEHTAHALVNTCYYGHIVADVNLILPVVEVLALELRLEQTTVAREVVASPSRALFGSHTVYLAHKSVVRILTVGVVEVEHLRHFEVLLPTHVARNRHLLRASGRAARSIVVVEVLWHRELHVVVHAEIFQICLPVAVRRLMVKEQAERFRRVAVLDEVESMVGGEVCRVALLHDELVVGVGATILRVPVLSLVVIHMIVVEALRVATHVPLAHNGCLIASLLQQFGEERARGVDALAQLALSVLMTVLTGHKAGARRRRERVLDEGAVEAHATLSESVDIRSWCEFGECAAVCADALVGMVVAHDVNNVWMLLSLLLLSISCRYAGEGCKRNN